MNLTENFAKSEFDSRCGSEMPEDVLRNVECLAKNLQVLRDNLEQPIVVNSGYRAPRHNRRVGGARNSYHLYGLAADIRIRGVQPSVIHEAIKSLERDGLMDVAELIVYKRFVHVAINQNSCDEEE